MLHTYYYQFPVKMHKLQVIKTVIHQLARVNVKASLHLALKFKHGKMDLVEPELEKIWRKIGTVGNKLEMMKMMVMGSSSSYIRSGHTGRTGSAKRCGRRGCGK